MDDDEVDDYEWTCAWAAFVRADLEDRLKGIYALFDYDGSNVLERSELMALIKAILMADSHGKKVPTDSDAQLKIDQIWKDYLVHGETLHVCEFENIAVSDSQIRHGLINMSVIRDGEVCESGQVFDVDIDEEIYLATDYEHDAEYQARKNGVEGRSAGTDDQGGLFMEAQEKRDMKDSDKGSGELKVEKVAPTNYKFDPRDTEAPDANLELEYVHGYRCFDVRNNIGYCDDGDNILYFTAAVAIIHNIASNTQKFVFENSDDIISLAIRGQICASAELGPKPIISLWSNETREVYGNLAGILTKGVLHMAFDNKGEKLAAVGMDSEKTVVVFDVKKWKAGDIHHKGDEDPGCVILRSAGPKLGREDGEKPDQVMHMLWNNFDDT